MSNGNINKQLQKLIREGLTMAQACESLGLAIEAGELAMISLGNDRNKEVSLGDLVESFKPEAVNILMEIARCSERDSDRVKACQILLEGKGVMPEVNAASATLLMEHFEKMKRVVGVPQATIEEKSSAIDADVISMGK
jgi:hypothetical protein